MEKNIYLDGEYLEEHPDWHSKDSPWKARRIKGILDANSIEPATVAEIGCGAGEILSQLEALYPSSVMFQGFEISPQAYELAVTRASDRLRFSNSDLLEEEHKPFDVMLCIDVFEHVENVFEFLRRLMSRAKWTVFHIPLDLSVQSVLRKGRISKNWEDVGHIHFYTKELALRLLVETGYNVVDHAYTASSIELQNYSALQVSMKLPRRLAFAMNQDLAVRILGGYSLLVLCKR